MAGDWIKVEKETPAKPEILAMAARLGISRGDVLALCLRFWSWADSHSLDGAITSVTPSALEAALGLTDGFATALCEVGWLLQRDSALIIPNFGRHFGQSAKQRALTSRRVVTHRQRKVKRKCNDDGVNSSSLLFSSSGGSKNDVAGGRDSPRGFVAPTVEEVRAYCAERGNNVDPEQFVDHYTANGWVQGTRGKPLKDWKAAVRTWEKNDFRSNGNGRPKEGFYDGLKEFVKRGGE